MTSTRSLSLAALFLVAALPAQDKHVLRYQYMPGAVVHHSSISDMTMKVDMGGEQGTIKVAREVFVKLTIREVKEGVASVEAERVRAKMQAATPKGNFKFDSEEDDKAPGMLAGMEEIVGAKIKGKLSPRGEWLEMTLPEDLADGPHASDLEQSMKSAVVALPTDGVEIGGTWETEIEMGGGQGAAAKIKLTNKLLAITAKSFEIEQTVKGEKKEDGEEGEAAPQKPEMKVKKGQGKGLINRATAFPMQMELRMEFEVAGPGGQGGMDIVQVQKMKEYTPAPKEEKKGADKKGADK